MRSIKPSSPLAATSRWLLLHQPPLPLPRTVTGCDDVRGYPIAAPSRAITTSLPLQQQQRSHAKAAPVRPAVHLEGSPSPFSSSSTPSSSFSNSLPPPPSALFTAAAAGNVSAVLRSYASVVQKKKESSLPDSPDEGAGQVAVPLSVSATFVRALRLAKDAATSSGMTPPRIDRDTRFKELLEDISLALSAARHPVTMASSASSLSSSVHSISLLAHLAVDVAALSTANVAGKGAHAAIVSASSDDARIETACADLCATVLQKVAEVAAVELSPPSSSSPVTTAANICRLLRACAHGQIYDEVFINTCAIRLRECVEIAAKPSSSPSSVLLLGSRFAEGAAILMHLSTATNQQTAVTWSATSRALLLASLSLLVPNSASSASTFSLLSPETTIHLLFAASTAAASLSSTKALKDVAFLVSRTSFPSISPAVQQYLRQCVARFPPSGLVATSSALAEAVMEMERARSEGEDAAAATVFQSASHEILTVCLAEIAARLEAYEGQYLDGVFLLGWGRSKGQREGRNEMGDLAAHSPSPPPMGTERMDAESHAYVIKERASLRKYTVNVQPQRLLELSSALDLRVVREGDQSQSQSQSQNQGKGKVREESCIASSASSSHTTATSGSWASLAGLVAPSMTAQKAAFRKPQGGNVQGTASSASPSTGAPSLAPADSSVFSASGWPSLPEIVRLCASDVEAGSLTLLALPLSSSAQQWQMMRRGTEGKVGEGARSNEGIANGKFGRGTGSTSTTAEGRSLSSESYLSCVQTHCCFSPRELVQIVHAAGAWASPSPSPSPSPSTVSGAGGIADSLTAASSSRLSLAAADAIHFSGMQAISYALAGASTAIEEADLLGTFASLGVPHRGLFAALARRAVARGTARPSRLTHVPTQHIATILYSLSLAWEFDQDAFAVLLRELRSRGHGERKEAVAAENSGSGRKADEQPTPPSLELASSRNANGGSGILHTVSRIARGLSGVGVSDDALEMAVAPDYEWGRGKEVDQQVAAQVEKAVDIRVSDRSSNISYPRASTALSLAEHSVGEFSPFRRFLTTLHLPLSDYGVDGEGEEQGRSSGNSSRALDGANSRSGHLPSLRGVPSYAWEDASLLPLLASPIFLTSVQPAAASLSLALRAAAVDVPRQLGLNAVVTSAHIQGADMRDGGQKHVAQSNAHSVLSTRASSTLRLGGGNGSGASCSGRSRLSLRLGQAMGGGTRSTHVEQVVSNLRSLFEYSPSVPDDDLVSPWHRLHPGSVASNATSSLILPLALPLHKVAFEFVVPSFASVMPRPVRMALQAQARRRVGEAGGEGGEVENIAHGKLPSGTDNRREDGHGRGEAALSPSSSASSSAAQSLLHAGCVPSLHAMWRAAALTGSGWTVVWVDAQRVRTPLQAVAYLAEVLPVEWTVHGGGGRR